MRRRGPEGDLAQDLVPLAEIEGAAVLQNKDALDEPNANLDFDGEVALDKAIREMKARGAAVIIIAHKPSALAAVERILVLKDGRILDLGERDDILRKVTFRPAPPPQARPPLTVVNED